MKRPTWRVETRSKQNRLLGKAKMPSQEELIAEYVRRVAVKRDVTMLLRTSMHGEEGGVPPHVVKAYEAATEGVEQIAKGRALSPEQVAGIEAIILPKIRPVLDVIQGDFKTDHPLWQKLNNDQEIRRRLKKALPSIGRIELPGNPDYPYGGTGFVVGTDLLMTNRHVAEIFSAGLGTRKLALKPGLRAGIDFLHELDGPTGTTLMVKEVVMIHPYWDMALLRVEGLPHGVEPIPLSLRDVPADLMIEVAAIGYPAFDYRNDSVEQNDLFRNVFGVKRLQPGTLGGRRDTESFGKMVPALRHNCSTLGGNSGSAIIDFEKGEVIALHFGGRYHDINYGVPGCELGKDGRVVDAGVKFAGNPPGGQPPWQNWWNFAEAVSTSSDDLSGLAPAGAVPAAQPVATPGAVKAEVMPGGAVQLQVPLMVTVRLGGVQPLDAALGPEKEGTDAEVDSTSTR